MWMVCKEPPLALKAFMLGKSTLSLPVSLPLSLFSSFAPNWANLSDKFTEKKRMVPTGNTLENGAEGPPIKNGSEQGGATAAGVNSLAKLDFNSKLILYMDLK